MSKTQELDSRAINGMLIEQLSSRDPMQVKEAADNVDEFTRTKMREDGFWMSKILPAKNVDFSDLTPQVDTDKPVIVIEKEPNSPAAITIPYGTLPMGKYIVGPKYRIMFARLATPRLSKDVVELGTYQMDIRQVLADNIVKDLLAQEDGMAIRTVNTIVGAAGSTVADTGTIQHRAFTAGITRESMNDALKIMNQTPNQLAVGKMLVNQVTVKDFQKAGPEELGNGIAEEVARNGWSLDQFFGVPTVVTIKRDIVADGEVFMFAEPKFLGKAFILEDTTMNIKREGHMLDMYGTKCIGSGIGNVAGVAKATFTGSATSGWRY